MKTPLPKDLETLFDKAPLLSPDDLAHLEEAGKKLENDPEFMEDLNKSLTKEITK